MGFSRQEYWRGELFPSPGDLPDPGIKTGSPALQADSLLTEPPGKPWLEMRLNIRTGQSEEEILFSSVGNDNMLCQSGV